jgi:hypothetical protein
MSELFSWLCRVLNTIKPGAGRRHPAPARNNRVRPALEALEDRAVPTVAFVPHFSGTTLAPPAGTTLAQEEAGSLKSPPVVLIFAGSDWTTTQGQSNEGAALLGVGAIFGSPYLSALDQYGSDGKATIFSFWQTNNTPTLTGNTPTGTDLRTFVKNEIASQKMTNPGLVPSATAIYFVISDPKDSTTASGTFGFNSSDGSAIHVAYVGAKAFSSGSLQTDAFTQVFSHELAEAMVPAIHVNDPGGLNLGFQISDGEPENFGNGYGYRLNGARVQAYWSQRDSAWVVPDGNSQFVWLRWSSATFDNTFSLEVDGDQVGTNFNDTLTLGRDPVTHGSRVTLNNQVFSFDTGQLRQIALEAGGGSNTVNVQSVLFGESVTVNGDNTGSTPDNVVVGNNGSLADIQGALTVGNSSGGKVALRVEAWADGPKNITITDHAVSVGSVTVNYNPYSPSNPGYGVMSVTIDDAFGQNYINAQSVPAYVPVSVNGNFWDVLSGPAAGQVHLYRWWYVSNAYVSNAYVSNA